MTNYAVLINDIADYEIHSSLEYIEYVLYEPTAARKLWSKIEKKKQYLAMNPYMYPAISVPNLAKKGFRFVVIGNYLMFYKINEAKKAVLIFRFLYGRRNWQELLKK